MIIKCKECGTSIEVDESLYENSTGTTTICPLCGEEVPFSIKKEEKKDERTEKKVSYDTNEDISFCSKCGNKLEQNEMFCSHCGNRVASNPTSTPHSPLPSFPAPPSKNRDSRLKTVEANRIPSTHTANRISGKSGFIILIVILTVIGSGFAFFFFANVLNDNVNAQKRDVVEVVSQEVENKNGETVLYGSIGGDNTASIQLHGKNGICYYLDYSRRLEIKNCDRETGYLEISAYNNESGQYVGTFSGTLIDGVYSGVFTNYRGVSLDFSLKE